MESVEAGLHTVPYMASRIREGEETATPNPNPPPHPSLDTPASSLDVAASPTSIRHASLRICFNPRCSWFYVISEKCSGCGEPAKFFPTHEGVR